MKRCQREGWTTQSMGSATTSESRECFLNSTPPQFLSHSFILLPFPYNFCLNPLLFSKRSRLNQFVSPSYFTRLTLTIILNLLRLHPLVSPPSRFVARLRVSTLQSPGSATNWTSNFALIAVNTGEYLISPSSWNRYFFSNLPGSRVVCPASIRPSAPREPWCLYLSTIVTGLIHI